MSQNQFTANYEALRANANSLLRQLGRQSNCKDCDEEIWWVTNRDGQNMPVNENLTSHWKTCPETKNYRPDNSKPVNPTDYEPHPDITYEQACAYRLPFGKNRGKSLEQIWDDPDGKGVSYIEWAVGSMDRNVSMRNGALAAVEYIITFYVNKMIDMNDYGDAQDAGIPEQPPQEFHGDDVPF